MIRLGALPLLALALSGCLAYHRGPLPGEPKTATFAALEGARVRYVDVGKGPPVVLVHGFASSLGVWSSVIPMLAKEHRVIALDLKGFGWSDRPEGDYSPAAEARLVLALLDARGIERAAFVGHSWGSSVVLAAALAAPSRVERIALYDAFVYEEQLPSFFTAARAPIVGEALFGLFYKERADERIALAFHDPELVTEAFVEDVEATLERPGTVAAALAAVRGQRFAEVEGRYRTIAQPTLLLWGRDDLVTPVAIGERLASELASSRLVVYPRCGHFPMLEANAASTAELQRFLRVASEPPASPRGPSDELVAPSREPAPPPSSTPPVRDAAPVPSSDAALPKGATP